MRDKISESVITLFFKELKVHDVGLDLGKKYNVINILEN